MIFPELIKRAERFAVANSPALLTGLGVTGVVATAYLTGKASFRAAQILRDESFLTVETIEGEQIKVINQVSHLSTKEKVNLVWKLYIPPALMVAGTVTSVIAANQIGSRRTAAMAAAFSLTDQAFSEYKDKVVEKLGEKKEQAVRDELAQSRVDDNPIGKNEVIIIDGGDVIFYDAWSGRYFMSTMEKVKKAMNDTNYTVLNDMSASLTDFYDKIGLSRTSNSDDIGWNCDELLDVGFSTCFTEDAKPCISIEFRVVPVKGYHRLH